MEDKSEQAVEIHQFDTVNKEFLRQIESLREVLPFIMIFVAVNGEKARKDFSDYIKKKGKEEKDEKGETFFVFSPEDAHIISSLEKNLDIASSATEIIPQSLFVSLISQYDCFLGRLIREILQIKPEILNNSEKILTYSKLIELKTIEEAKEFIIEKEVESVLRNSHSEQFDWLENKLNIQLRKNFPIWQTFIEITERRNLFSHCDGKVSNQYLSNCKKNKVPFEKEPKIGHEFDVSPEYFESAFKCLYEVTTKLTQVIWRKLIPSDLKKADESLNDICFDLINYGQYDLANTLLDFATNILHKHFNEESKNVFIINQALSLKLGGNKQKSEEILLSKDWSASSDKFKIAKETLLDNFEDAAKLMKKIGANGEIEKMSYKSWPLFLEFRKTKVFTDTFYQVFNEEFTLVETPKKLFDNLVLQLAEIKKQKHFLNTTSFIEVAHTPFPNYQFIHFKADGFVKLILELDTKFTTEQFRKAINDNINIVKQFNEYIILQSPNQYLNPYTMLRHCLYLYNKEKFHNMLFDIQRESFEKWLIEKG